MKCHALSINGKHKDILKEDLMSIAKANNIKKAKKIIEEIKSIVCNWKSYADNENVNKQLRDSISKTLIALK